MDAMPYLCIKAHVVSWPVCMPQLLAANVQVLVASFLTAGPMPARLGFMPRDFSGEPGPWTVKRRWKFILGSNKVWRTLP